jgi:ATP-dependent Lhr-like helicase
MLSQPPHILVTTPESLYILLTAERSRAILRPVETVIVDEIHAVADDKRGAHLALSLERLEHAAWRPPVRIGLSATQKPIEELARFLTVNGRPDPVIVNVGHRRKLDLAVEVPKSPLGAIASNEMWDEIYERVVELVGQHRSTLLFVNTRRLVERISHQLSERLGEDQVAAHHGSLSRKLRLAAEKKLKEGRVRVLVATASLELGIDIGTVDLVVQISSPRAIAVALQRVGRSGHWRGAVPKGRFFATTRDELQECAALVRAIEQGDLDRITIPDAPLDILAQQIVATCASQPTAEAGGESEGWAEDELFHLLRRAYPYRDLSQAHYQAVVEMLSEGIASNRGRYGAYLHRDRIHGRVRARRGSRLAAITSGGAIPETALFTVVAEPEGVVVGTLDEDFAVESNAGDIMLLGNTSWRIRRIEGKSGRVLVEDAHGAPPSVPFWRGEAPARTEELSLRVSELRREISERLAHHSPVGVSFAEPSVAAVIAWLKQECGLDDCGAEQAIEYVLEGRAVLGTVPTQDTIVAERFFDEGGGMQLVIHAPFGGRINKAWGLALRKRFCRSFNFELQAAATDNGLNIALAEQHSFPLADVFQFLHADTVQPVLEQAALASPIFATRWRWDANRALALLRFQGGKKVPPQIQRMRSDDLLASVFPDVAACQENIEGDIQIPDHPLVHEVMKDVLTEAMDIVGLRRVLGQIEARKIRCVAVDTPVPSQFSHEILNANPYAYLDDAPLEERRARAVEMRRVLPPSVLEQVGRLDPAAIAQVREEVSPDVRDADELHDLLYTLVLFPASGQDGEQHLPQPVEWRAAAKAAPSARWAEEPGPAWPGYFARLLEHGRAVRAFAKGRLYWVAAERAAAFSALHPDARFEPLPPAGEAAISFEEALRLALNGWIFHSGPVTSIQLGARFGVSATELEKTFLRIEAAGTVLRGRFTDEAIPLAAQGGPGFEQWCERRCLARIHRLTIGALRRQIEPVTSAHFMRWLLRWQHVASDTRVEGERATLEVLRQLQGFEIPANAWESHILSRRITNYDPKWLDQLCLTGAVGWGRLSPHPATLEDAPAGKRRVIPTSVAPITFFVREDADWMTTHAEAADGLEVRVLTDNAREVLAFLKQRGASFFADIVRATNRMKAEVETGLWELVAAGIVTADGFENLRSLIEPRRRAGGRAPRPRHTSGRWALLYTGPEVERNRAAEATCRVLLRRYGIVFRDLLARETNLPKWRELHMGFRRLEDRGEIRGGRFVDGFVGEQFALPVALESLRALRELSPSGETISLSAADPLNLVGILVPGDRVPAVSGRSITLANGAAVEPMAEEKAQATA